MVRDRTRRASGCSRCTNTHTSHSERRLFEAVSHWLDDAEQGKRFDWARFGPARISADISGKYQGRPVVIEYDGQFWHRDSTERDARKTALFIEAGYLVVRVREGKLHKLPDQRGLIQLDFESVSGTDESTRRAFGALSERVRLAVVTAAP